MRAKSQIRRQHHIQLKAAVASSISVHAASQMLKLQSLFVFEGSARFSAENDNVHIPDNCLALGFKQGDKIIFRCIVGRLGIKILKYILDIF